MSIESDRMSFDVDPAEIVSARTLAAPRHAVFDAFADPERLVHWWGPKGFTNEFHEFDLRPGGCWRFTMRGPDDATYEIEKRFFEIAPPERIVFDHVQEGHGFRMTMKFDEAEGGTLLTWRMRFSAPEEAEKLRSFITQANEENFDRLEQHLAVVHRGT